MVRSGEKGSLCGNTAQPPAGTGGACPAVVAGGWAWVAEVRRDAATPGLRRVRVPDRAITQDDHEDFLGHA